MAAAGRSGLHTGFHARPLDDAWDGSSARLNRLAADATARASACADARSASELRAAAAAPLRADARSAMRADGLRAASLCTELAVVRTARHALLGAAAWVARAAGAALQAACAALEGRPALQRVALLLRQLAQRARRCSGATKAPRMTSVAFGRDAGDNSRRIRAHTHSAC